MKSIKTWFKKTNKKVTKIIFKPQKDITAYKLAMSLKYEKKYCDDILWTNPEDVKIILSGGNDGISKECLRHFVTEKIIVDEHGRKVRPTT